MVEVWRREKKYRLTCDIEADDQDEEQEAAEDAKADPRAPVDYYLLKGIVFCVLVSVKDEVGEHQEETEAEGSKAWGSKEPADWVGPIQLGQWWHDEGRGPEYQEVDCQDEVEDEAANPEGEDAEEGGSGKQTAKVEVVGHLHVWSRHYVFSVWRLCVKWWLYFLQW